MRHQFAGAASDRVPPVSVWATGQHDTTAQLAHGAYQPATARDTAGIPPAVAAHAIAAYTAEGETVLDPDCGAGTVLVEALRAGRHAIGITSQARWWPIARANVTAAKHDGAPGDGMVLDGPPETTMPRLADRVGPCDLLLTTCRSTPPPRGHREDQSASVRTDADAVRLRTLLAGSRPLLRPGGHAIVIAPRRRCRGVLLDLPARVIEAGRGAGLVPVERCVALLAELRGDRLVVRASLAQRRTAARHERALGRPIMLPAHLDVVILQAPPKTAAAALPARPPFPDAPGWGERAAAAPSGRAA